MIDTHTTAKPAGYGSAASTRDTGVYQHRRYAGLSRTAIVFAFLLSLLLHGVVILALLDTERPPADAAHAMIVTVDLAASQPTAPPPMPAAPSPAPHAAAIESQHKAEDLRRQDDEAPHTDGKSTRPAASSARVASVPNAHEINARPTVRSMQKTEMPPAPPRFAESPDNRAFDSPSAYLRLLAMRLAEVKQYPTAAASRHEEGMVLLAFRLDRSGRVLSWEIARSSGHDELDAEVSRMVALAAPFPPFPASWREASATFQVPIGFSLN